MASRPSAPARWLDARATAELKQLCKILPRGRGPDARKAAVLDLVKSPVEVLCRFRGQSIAERAKGGFDAWDLDNESVSGISGCSSTPPSFSFDCVFGPHATQNEVYEAIKPLISDFLGGFNCAVLCYGQTSAGKTYTMAGPRERQDSADSGFVPRMLTDVFDVAEDGCQFHFAMLEIYQERLRDLLNPDSSSRLRVLEGRSGEVAVQGLREVRASSSSEALGIFWRGTQRRVTAATGMNDASSRSHCMFVLKVETTSGSSSKFYFVDLAGSESVKKAGLGNESLGSTTELSEESKSINQSLSTLGLVLRRLVERKRSSMIGGATLERRRSSVGSIGGSSVGSAQEPHVPYRSSKLTRVLQGVLSGNTRTTLVINCSISSLQVAETLSTLRFGQRARCLTTNARNAALNADLGQQLPDPFHTLRAAREEIQRLRTLVVSSADPQLFSADDSPCYPCPSPRSSSESVPNCQRFLTADSPCAAEPYFAMEDVEKPSHRKKTSRSRSSSPPGRDLGSFDSLTLAEVANSHGGADTRAPQLAPASSLSLPLSASKSQPCLSTTTDKYVKWLELTPRVSPPPTQAWRALPLPPARSSRGFTLESSPQGARPLSWEYPLTRKDCYLLELLAQEQRTEEMAQRLSKAEAELEWLQYLTPGGTEVPALASLSDEEEQETQDASGCQSTTMADQADLTLLCPSCAGASIIAGQGNLSLLCPSCAAAASCTSQVIDCPELSDIQTTGAGRCSVFERRRRERKEEKEKERIEKEEKEDIYSEESLQLTATSFSACAPVLPQCHNEEVLCKVVEDLPSVPVLGLGPSLIASREPLGNDDASSSVKSSSSTYKQAFLFISLPALLAIGCALALATLLQLDLWAPGFK